MICGVQVVLDNLIPFSELVEQVVLVLFSCDVLCKNKFFQSVAFIIGFPVQLQTGSMFIQFSYFSIHNAYHDQVLFIFKLSG